MKRILVFVVAALMALGLAAQEMSVKSMNMEPMDLTAATNQRLDLNGVPCAVVKVQMPRGGAFEGSIIGDVEYRTGEYWVYMPANSKALRVKHESAKPLMVSFEEPLIAKATYVLDIAMPSAAPAAAATQQKVEIRFSPAGAVVLIDDQLADVSGNTATATLPADRDYSYTVTARGYISQRGSFHLHPAVPTHLNVELMADPAVAPQQQPAVQQQQEQPQVQQTSQLSENEIAAAGDNEFNNKNYARAFDFYKQIPKNMFALNRIGWMYETGNGVGQNYAEAVKWYRKAAEQGYAAAQCNLGYMYSHGRGVSQNYAEAVKWYRKSAEQGYAQAQNNLGYMYDSGQGVNKSDAEALKWYRKAAEQGNSLGQANLGYMYEVGQGVRQDYAEAAKWYRKAAEQGLSTAQHNLGLAYYYGRGVGSNKQEAYKWIRKAADQGYEKAVKFINEHTF